MYCINVLYEDIITRCSSIKNPDELTNTAFPCRPECNSGIREEVSHCLFFNAISPLAEQFNTLSIIHGKEGQAYIQAKPIFILSSTHRLLSSYVFKVTAKSFNTFLYRMLGYER